MDITPMFRTTNKPTIFIFAITFIIIFWSLITPAFEFPDEQAHFGTTSFLLAENHVPVGKELDMTQEMASTQELLGIYRNSQGQNNYTYHPEYHLKYSDSQIGISEQEIINLNTPDLRSAYIATEAARYPRLYYDYESIFVKLVNSSDIFTRLFLARLGGIIFTLFMAYLVYQTGLLIFTRPLYASTLTTMVMLQPMFSFISAGVNSDNLHNLLFTIVIYTGIKIIKSGFLPTTLILALTATILDIYSKPQGVLAIPIILLAILIRIIKAKNWRWLINLFLVGGLIILTGWNQFSRYLGIISSTNSHGASLLEFVSFSINKLVSQNIVWYWGVFKWLGVVLPPIYWQLANRVVLISALGLIVYLVKVIKKRKILISPYAICYLLLTTSIYTLAIYYFDWHHTKTVGFSLGIQARYFFPTIILHMSLLMTGILSLAPSQKIRTFLARGLVALFLWLQLGGIWTLITSYYDTNSLNSFITQVSQYKPWFAKGDWWYLYITLYIISLYVIIHSVLTSSDSD